MPGFISSNSVPLIVVGVPEPAPENLESVLQLTELKDRHMKKSKGGLLSTLCTACVVMSSVLLTGCTHTIRHVPGNFTTQGSTGEIDLVMSPEVCQRVVDKKIGINVDKWRFQIGAAVSDLLPKALGVEYAKVGLVSSTGSNVAAARSKVGPARLVIHSIDLDLSAGSTVFGSHEVTVILGVEYFDSKGNLVLRKTLSGSGAESGSDRLSTWAGFIQSSQFTAGMNEALDVAVTNGVLAAARRIVDCIEQKGACS